MIILINAIFIALDDRNPLISHAEWGFLSLYIIEILLKLYTYDPRTFFGKNQFWNWYVVVLLFSVHNSVINSFSLWGKKKPRYAHL